MLVRRKLTAVPWMKLRLRRYGTFFSSSFRIFCVVAVQPRDLLLPEPEALHQLDVAQRLGRRSGQRRRLGDDHLLDLLDAAAQHRAEDAEERHRQEVDRRDQPVRR